MKVLFVASGNKAVGSVSAFVQSQYDSLDEEGLEMILFPVVGHGFWGYVKHVFELRKLVRKERPDIVHAHYSVCGYLASLASCGLKSKVVVSILGSFPRKSRKLELVSWCIDKVWDATIVKSERTRSQLDRDLPVIPNGVNIEQFNVIDQNEARVKVGFDVVKKYVIFVVCYSVIVYIAFSFKYSHAKHNLKIYFNNLKLLGTLYVKEKENEEDYGEN